MQKWLWQLAKLGGLAILLYFCFIASLMFGGLGLNFALPTSETLAWWHLDEVVHGTATELDTPYIYCDSFYLGRNRMMYRGAKLRNIEFEFTQGSGSNDSFQSVIINFSYLAPNSTTWQRGSISTLSTDFELFNPRKLTCMY